MFHSNLEGALRGQYFGIRLRLRVELQGKKNLLVLYRPLLILHLYKINTRQRRALEVETRALPGPGCGRPGKPGKKLRFKNKNQQKRLVDFFLLTCA